jgi:hypothetical protein
MTTTDRLKIVGVKLLDKWVNPDLRKRIILTLITYAFTLVSGTLLNVNINRLTIKNGDFSLDLILSQTSNYVIFAFALMFLLAAVYQTSYLIKQETLLAIKKTQYDEALVDRIDNVVSLTNLIVLFDHINANLTVLEPDLDIIPDLETELNRADSKFQSADIEYLRDKTVKSINDLSGYITRQFHNFRNDASIMLMPDQRNTQQHSIWTDELRVKVNKAKSDFTDFRQYCTEKLIK